MVNTSSEWDVTFVINKYSDNSKEIDMRPEASQSPCRGNLFPKKINNRNPNKGKRRIIIDNCVNM
jgi:hypothetical protein